MHVLVPGKRNRSLHLWTTDCFIYLPGRGVSAIPLLRAGPAPSTPLIVARSCIPSFRCRFLCVLCFSLRGRFFYRMVDDSLPQWIRTYPEDAAPRTGDGLFPGEVIEVTQVRARYTCGWIRGTIRSVGTFVRLFVILPGHTVEDSR